MADSDDEVSKRIEQLGNKATQLLLFLSFALLAAVYFETSQCREVLGSAQMAALKCAMKWWVGALFPILVSVLPVKELFRLLGLKLSAVRRYKIVLLWAAILTILFGAGSFFSAIR
jgi:hypothetical protein